MDMSCRNGSMACCDRDLMQVGNRVPGGIEPLNRTALMLINFKQLCVPKTLSVLMT
jgi:hypothetical protein